MLFDKDKWQEIFNSIWRHKLRTFLTALGVFWGIFMLVLLLGAGNGLRNGIEYQFRDDAVNSIWIHSGTTSLPHQGLKEGRRINFDNKDYDYLRSEFSEIDALTGRLYLDGDQTVTYGFKSLAYSTRGVHPDHKILENTIITEGRFINQHDLDNTTKVAVIGKLVKENLFGDENPIGKQIKIGDISYQVVGTFMDTGGDWEMRRIYLPITTAQKVYEGTDRLHALMLTGSGLSVEEMNALENKVRNTLASRKGFDPNDRKAIHLFNLAKEFQQMSSLFLAINGIIWLVGIFSIIAGVIGVSNIMLIVVKDRTKEIGIRKALGATPGSIISMILQESIFITSLAGYLGVVVGIGVIYLASGLESEFFRSPQVNLGLVMTAVIILVISGALAGLLPAYQAAKINPVIAMKAD